MSFETESVRLRPLGYDLRMTGPRADADRQARNMTWRPDLIAASYDAAVQPPLMITADHARDKADFQRVLDARLVSDPYFPTFHLFRSDREALSFMGDRTDNRDIDLLFYALIWPDHPPEGLLLGMLRAMEGEVVPAPDLQADRIGYEVLDRDGGSVTHSYLDPQEALLLDPHHPQSEANRLAQEGFWMMSISRISHPWWLR